MALQLKRGTSSARKNSTVILNNGQPFFETDTHYMYIGDGTTQLKNLTTAVKVNPSTLFEYSNNVLTIKM